MANVKKRLKTKDGEWVTKGGTVVTPKVEERWSEECEGEFHLADFTRVRVGRPPLDGERVSQRISIRIPPDLFAAAQAKAGEERRSLGNLTREALRRHVEA
jgi:predicted HicB family RNase H-like nuclease